MKKLKENLEKALIMKINFDKLKFIRVKVFPDSGKEKIFREKEKLIIYLKEKPEKNLVNKRIFEILSFIFPEKRIELTKGLKQRNKIFKIYDKK